MMRVVAYCNIRLSAPPHKILLLLILLLFCFICKCIEKAVYILHTVSPAPLFPLGQLLIKIIIILLALTYRRTPPIYYNSVYNIPACILIHSTTLCSAMWQSSWRPRVVLSSNCLKKEKNYALGLLSCVNIYYDFFTVGERALVYLRRVVVIIWTPHYRLPCI